MRKPLRDLSIVLLGSGNMATQLGLELKKAGAKIIQVYSPTLKHVRRLAKKLDADFSTDIHAIHPHADVYLIALKDEAIEKISTYLHQPGKLVLHTSGSVSLAALQHTGKNTGVLYPLQTITKEKALDFRKVPICIEASSRQSRKQLLRIADAISEKVYELDSQQRETVHVAAVFANNFSNHFYALAHLLLDEQKLPFELIQPLILETAQKVQHLHPLETQTGPARRNDKAVMRKHIQLLHNHPDLQRLYRLISAGIQKHTS
jgi:predicted short-subunit dehydrogenase-like oxidoreductase (DUF2520 family)